MCPQSDGLDGLGPGSSQGWLHSTLARTSPGRIAVVHLAMFMPGTGQVTVTHLARAGQCGLLDCGLLHFGLSRGQSIRKQCAHMIKVSQFI